MDFSGEPSVSSEPMMKSRDLSGHFQSARLVPRLPQAFSEILQGWDQASFTVNPDGFPGRFQGAHTIPRFGQVHGQTEQIRQSPGCPQDTSECRDRNTTQGRIPRPDRGENRDGGQIRAVLQHLLQRRDERATLTLRHIEGGHPQLWPVTQHGACEAHRGRIASGRVPRDRVTHPFVPGVADRAVVVARQRVPHVQPGDDPPDSLSTQHPLMLMKQEVIPFLKPAQPGHDEGAARVETTHRADGTRTRAGDIPGLFLRVPKAGRVTHLPFNNEAHVPANRCRRRHPELPGPAGGGPQGVASQRVDHPRGGSRPDRGVVERSAAVGRTPSLGSSVARPQWWPVSFHRVHDCHIHAARARPFLRHVRHGPGSPPGFPVVVDL